MTAPTLLLLFGSLHCCVSLPLSVETRQEELYREGERLTSEIRPVANRVNCQTCTLAELKVKDAEASSALSFHENKRDGIQIVRQS